MRKTELNGEWILRKTGTKKNFPAHVPGCVHSDLVDAGELGNLFPGKALEKSAWVCDSGWEYEKVFASDEMLAFDAVVLRFEGIMGAAEIFLNEKKLGEVNNPFEDIEFDVKHIICPGRNTLLVRFAPPSRENAKGSEHVRRVEGALSGRTQPPSPTVGIWRKVSLLAFTNVRIKDVASTQSQKQADGPFDLDVDVTSETFQPGQRYELLVRVCYKGNILSEKRELLMAPITHVKLQVKNPQLWWPAGLGDQPLYEMTVDILSGHVCHEHISRRIGLCSFKTVLENVGGQIVRRFYFNRHPFFLKGGSWIAADLHLPCLTRVEYARLIKAASIANMNTLRVWAGVGYESDEFYDLCDEYGVCVIQDLPLTEAHKAGPDASTLAAFTRELAFNIPRVRSHACLLGWTVSDCMDVSPEYEQAARPVFAALDPNHPLLTSRLDCPFTLGGNAGFNPVPAYSAPRMVASYLEEEERNVSHPVNLFHVSPPDGIQWMYNGFLNDYLLPSSFSNTIWLSQIQQGVAMKEQIECQRAGGSKAAGFLFWHFNESWPSCSPSSVDYEGRWKARHYLARRFFAPLTCYPDYNKAAGAVALVAINDTLKPFRGSLQWKLETLDGTIVAEGAKRFAIDSAGKECIQTIRVEEALKRHGAGNLFLWFNMFDADESQVAWNYQRFCAWRELETQPPHMRAEIRSWDDNSFAVTLTARLPAFWVWLSLVGVDARFDDNFFCIEPSRPFRVRVTPYTRMRLEQFRQALRIGSLRDTFRNPTVGIDKSSL